MKPLINYTLAVNKRKDKFKKMSRAVALRSVFGPMSSCFRRKFTILNAWHSEKLRRFKNIFQFCFRGEGVNLVHDS